MMARAKRSLSSLLDDEQPSQEQSADDATVTEAPPFEERAETSLAIVPAPAEPVAIAEPVGASDPATGAAAEVTPAPQAAPAATASAPAPSQRSGSSADGPASASAKSRTAAVRQIKAAPELDRLPLYLELTRKEARFRQDQLNALTTLTRQLNRRRASTGERITDNTLIRVAVDMMLEVAESLDGSTEADLLAAVRSRLK